MAKYAHDDDYDNPRERVSARQMSGQRNGKTICAVGVVVAIIAAVVILAYFLRPGSEVLGSLGD